MEFKKKVNKMQTLNAIGLIGFIVSVTIYIPFLMFLALCAWSALIEKIRTVIGVEQAVMDYMKNKAEFAEWKRNKAADGGE
jgi:hypothetical protein